MPVQQPWIVAASQAKSNGSPLGNVFLLVAFVLLLLMFLRSRRAAKRRTESLRSAITVGQNVMTSSGIFATVVASDEESWSLEVADGVVMRFAKAAVTRVMAEPDPAKSSSTG